MVKCIWCRERAITQDVYCQQCFDELGEWGRKHMGQTFIAEGTRLALARDALIACIKASLASLVEKDCEMNYASLELCKELYKLSGWAEPELHGHYKSPQAANRLPSEEICPAYDLGYLLRKFIGKGGVELRYGDKGCIATSHMASTGSNTPEDAVARLAIELFRQGIFERE